MLLNLLGWHWLIKLYRYQSEHFYSTSPVYCIVCSPFRVKSPPTTLYLTPFTLYYLPSPLLFPSGNHHTIVCVYGFLFVCFSYLLFSVLYPTYDWNHMVLDFFPLDNFTQHIFITHPCCHKWQYFIFSYGWVVFRCTVYTYYTFFSLSSMEGQFFLIDNQNKDCCRIW